MRFLLPSRRALLAAVAVAPLALGLTACDTTDDDDDDTLNIVATAQTQADLSTLVQAITAAQLTADLSDPDAELTVFAPTNAAFDALPAGTVESLLLPENRAQLQAILGFHAAEGDFEANDLTDGRVIRTTEDRTITVVRTGSTVGLDTDGDGNADATVTTANIRASNGIVHKIDAVLLPPAE